MANPAFSDKILERAMSGFSDKSQTMTVNGTINKAFILTLLLLASGIYTYNMVSAGNVASAMSYLMGGIIGGLIVSIIMMFKMEWARFLAPIYAVLEGLAIGAISGVYGMAFQGIVGQAIHERRRAGVAGPKKISLSTRTARHRDDLHSRCLPFRQPERRY